MLKRELVFKLLGIVNRNLENDKQEDLLIELLQYRFDELDDLLFKNGHYRKCLAYINKKYKELEQDLKDRKSTLKLLDEYIEISNNNLTYCDEFFYKVGLKDGLNLLLSTIKSEELGKI